MNREARMGMISLVVILLVGWGITWLTNAQRQKQFGTPYHVIFFRVEGLEEGCKVYYSGRLVGRVRKLEVRPDDQRVDVTISINPLARNVVLTRESSYSVEGGIWGERSLNINYQPGTVIPADGEVQGLSVPRVSHMIRHGLGVLDELQAMASDYQGKMGEVEEARRKANKTVQYYNDMAFEMRVQANRFNKFSGLINEQLDAVVVKVQKHLGAVSQRAALAGAQARMYANGIEKMVVQKDRNLHGMLMAFHQRLVSAVAPMEILRHNVDAYDTKALAMTREMRKKTESIREIVETLRLISHNPRLKQQFRQMTGDLRTRMHLLRQMMKNPGSAPAPPPAGPGGVPELGPSPATQPGVGIPSLPAAPGIPMPPDGPSTGPAPKAPRRSHVPVPLPTVQAP